MGMYITDATTLQRVSQSLNRRFANEDIKSLPGRGGSTQRYIEGTSVIDRLNEAFTPLGWSFHCKHIESLGDAATSKQIAVYGELVVDIQMYGPDGSMFPSTITKGQWGSREVKSNDSGTSKMEYGDDLKSASTDALKKCATLFGIGNHLYRKPRPAASSEVQSLAKEMDEVRKAKNMSGQQMMDLFSGVIHKTVESSADLSYTQALVCLEVLKSQPVLA